MPEYLAPGVYVEEQDLGPVPIEGVSTSTAGFVGMTAQGPTDGPPVLVTSFSEFTRTFGGYLPALLGENSYLPYAVKGFFENGGQRVYIKRVISETSAHMAESTNLKGGLITQLSKNVNKGDKQGRLITLRGVHVGTSLTFNQVKDGAKSTQTVKVVTYDDGTGTVTWADAATDIFDARYTTVVTDTSNTAITPFVITTASKGQWGNDLVIQIFHTSRARAEVQSLIDPKGGTDFNTVVLNSAANFYKGAIVEFNTGAAKFYSKVVDINGKSISVNPALSAADALKPADANIPTTAYTCEFRLTVATKDSGVSEDYPFLTLDDTTPYYAGKLINGISSLITVAGKDDTQTDPFTLPSTDSGVMVKMDHGADGDPATANDYIGVDGGPGNRSGIQALIDIEDISIIAAPGMTDLAVVNELINQCELLKYRFAIIDPQYGKARPMDDIQKYRQRCGDTRYAALYFPRLVISDPSNAAGAIVVPPSGHMAGMYARTDVERGVHKAPANEVISGITDLDLIINKREQDILNVPPNQINVLRDFRSEGRGLRVWGARCITSDAAWKYINVRRLFIFIEASLDQGTQWVVFEPNDTPLWARVTQSISNFLTRVWHDGALMGQKVEEAFFIKCDRTTMTQDDIDNGRLIVLVGIAPVKPAEYVIIRISQYAGGASGQ